jgi:hypothetical protein
MVLKRTPRAATVEHLIDMQLLRKNNPQKEHVETA